jgi:hypothetical protein
VLPTGEVAAIDPIMAPGGVAPHTHVFFGAENVTASSTWSDLLKQPTTSQNTKDTAAYWVPQLYFRGKPWTPGCIGTPPELTCGSDPTTTYYLRVYYTTTDPANTIQLPRVMMVTGYPGATADPHITDPTSMKRVHYTCGNESAAGAVSTSLSSWPYSCNNFKHPSFDGVVMIIDFPECWNGNVSGILNGERVVQYIDSNVTTGPTSDLTYASGGTCPADFPLRVPHVSIHVHTLIENPSSDGSTIWPSDCTRSSFPCQTQTEPPLSGPGAVGIGLASDAGTPGGWYTLHADFVQSWHMGTTDGPFSTQPLPDQDADERPGTLNDLTEDCLIAGMICSFQPDVMGSFVGD